jgi:hypothetical protein
MVFRCRFQLPGPRAVPEAEAPEAARRRAQLPPARGVPACVVTFTWRETTVSGMTARTTATVGLNKPHPPAVGFYRLDGSRRVRQQAPGRPQYVRACRHASASCQRPSSVSTWSRGRSTIATRCGLLHPCGPCERYMHCLYRRVAGASTKKLVWQPDKSHIFGRVYFWTDKSDGCHSSEIPPKGEVVGPKLSGSL